MKTIVYLISGFLLVSVLIIGCEKNSNESSGIKGKLTGISTCKNLKSAGSLEVTPDTLSCISYSYDAVEEKLLVTHVNAAFNCCFDTVLCNVRMVGDTIVIEETEEMENGCNCDCLYDVDIEIAGIKARSYKIKVTEPYAGEQAVLEGEIDLDLLYDSSICVTRKEYPWGIP